MFEGIHMKKDNLKAGILRWWVAGMCYFFIGFGTPIGISKDPLDLMFILGMGIGIATICIYNPIAYRMFRIEKRGKIFNKTYYERTGWQNAMINILEIVKNVLIVVLIYYTYQNLNLLLNQLAGYPLDTITVPGEPFGFASLYMLYYCGSTSLVDAAGRAVRKDGDK